MWIRFRSCRTVSGQKSPPNEADRELTSDTGKELSRKTLDLAVRERYELIAFEEIEYALAQQVHDDADVAPVVEAVAEMNAPVTIFGVVRLERRQNPELYP